MDFFARQEEARRKSWLLLPLFAVAVLGVSWLVNRFFAALLLLLLPFQGGRSGAPLVSLDWYDLFLRFHPQVTACTILVITLGAAWRAFKLRAGGSAVAELMGAYPLTAGNGDDEERRVLNIVEEMSLASGMAVPATYVLTDEASINAFAAGGPDGDGVLAVTAGATDGLDRDELQAVVAHEFSHLLNGDSRLNLRLLSLLSGLMAVSSMGALAKAAAATPGRRSSPSEKRSLLGEFLASVVLYVVGFGLSLIGSVGVVCGRMIRAGVSRQREFLADAAAVQFTRNPQALISALRKIAAQPLESVLENEHREEVSHMLFVPGRRKKRWRVFDTHPPIEDRLRALDPSLDRQGVRPSPSPAPRPSRPERDASELSRPTPVSVVSSLGQLDNARLEFARRLHGRIPDAVRTFARTPGTAPGVVYGVLLGEEKELADAQIGIVGSAAGNQDVMAALFASHNCVKQDREALRLALIELALPALRSLDPEARPRVVDTTRKLVDADGQRTLFEYAVYTLVATALGNRPAAANRVQYHSLAPVRPGLEKVLWVLARTGQRTPDEARSAYAAGANRLGLASPSPDPAAAEGAKVPADLPQSLAQLRGLAPSLKKDVLEALAACALADRQITYAEAEVLRAVSAAIGCPLPPLVLPQ